MTTGFVGEGSDCLSERFFIFTLHIPHDNTTEFLPLPG